MPLTALDIYKQLPRSNCGECGFPTCLAFAMQLAQKRVALDDCPRVTPDGRAALEGASAPPIKLVTIGASEDSRLQIGNETVLFRHDETFYHPTGVAVQISDAQDDEELQEQLAFLNQIAIERVGTTLTIDLVAVRADSGDPARFAKVVEMARSSVGAGGRAGHPLILISRDPAVMKAGLEVCQADRPLIYAADAKNAFPMASLAKQASCPLAVVAESVEALAELTPKIQRLGVEELVLGLEGRTFHQTLQDLTVIRRLALKQALRPLGYPTIVFVDHEDPYQAAARASAYVTKYAGIVVLEAAQLSQLISLLTVRLNVFTDPRHPIQVEQAVYEVREPGPDSPVILTVNFALTYYTVRGDVENSGVPTWIVVHDTEGTSVLTAYAADKMTADGVAAQLKADGGIQDKVNHREIIIPGLVAVMTAKLREESGWNVVVGPRESSGLPRFLRSYQVGANQ
jgi:acetyl-CoA decarbonylase/synthase complex subunit gamma